jgi:hypothetical protein
MALPAYTTLLTDVLPTDIGALESSIGAFFDRMESLGTNLGEGRLHLLFSAGIVTALAAVVEVTRRKMKPDPPGLVLRQLSIPYSDSI